MDVPTTTTSDTTFHSMPYSSTSSPSISSTRDSDRTPTRPFDVPESGAVVGNYSAPLLAYTTSAQPLLDPANDVTFTMARLPLGARPSRAPTDIQNDAAAQHQMNLSRAKLKATSRTSALLAGFAMVALVELDYEQDVSKVLMIVFAVITTLLVSVHLLALMMSTCILPHMEVSNNLADSPHYSLRWYIELSWFFSTFLGLLLFLLEIGVVFWIKFIGIHYMEAAYVTTAILVPVFVIFMLFSYAFYKKLMHHHVERLDSKLGDLQKMWGDWQPNNSVSNPPQDKQMQGVTVM